MVTMVVVTVVTMTVAMAVAITIINVEWTEGLLSTTLCPGEGLSLWRGGLPAGQEYSAGEEQSQVAPGRGAGAQSTAMGSPSGFGPSWMLRLQKALGFKDCASPSTHKTAQQQPGLRPRLGVKGQVLVTAERAQLSVRRTWLRAEMPVSFMVQESGPRFFHSMRTLSNAPRV